MFILIGPLEARVEVNNIMKVSDGIVSPFFFSPKEGESRSGRYGFK